MPAISYEEALGWLYSQTRAGAPRSQARMLALWQALGLVSPKACIYVVGTNGKGSVASMLAAGLAHEGYKTGCFTSPHVSDFRERIRFNGQFIPKDRVLAFLKEARELELELKPAFFELSFALALGYFADMSVDYAVIESGVGARHDATNLIENVKASIITNVSLDHKDSLGPTLEAIASDKAEAIRPFTPVFSAAKDKALDIIKAKALALASPLTVIASSGPLAALEENKALVKACLGYLGLSEPSIAAGLEDPKLPARLERFTINGRLLILDGGHNPDAIRLLQASLESPFVLIFSAKHSKDAQASFAILKEKAACIYLTSILSERPKLYGYPYFEQAEEALRIALAQPSHLPIVISGSFYLAGSLRPILQSMADKQN